MIDKQAASRPIYRLAVRTINRDPEFIGSPDARDKLPNRLITPAKYSITHFIRNRISANDHLVLRTLAKVH